MDYNIQAIKRAFSVYWKAHKSMINFMENGEKVDIDAIPSFDIFPEEGIFGDGYNFLCSIPFVRVSINGVEEPRKAEFIMKVGLNFNADAKPCETICGIKDNKIYLKPKH